MANIYYNAEYKPETVTDDVDTISNAFPSKVILFNDNVHSFDDVISQLIKAIGCSSGQAEAFAWEVHTKGKACVFTGEIEKCLRVSGVLEEIGLHTQIES
jgi:ATP-dependent Clp protease adapter protein ClpS